MKLDIDRITQINKIKTKVDFDLLDIMFRNYKFNPNEFRHASNLFLFASSIKFMPGVLNVSIDHFDGYNEPAICFQVMQYKYELLQEETLFDIKRAYRCTPFYKGEDIDIFMYGLGYCFFYP
jgi:hypothetical protein